MNDDLNSKLSQGFVFENRRDTINKYEKCGDETIKLINDLNPELVLDLGCGKNMYKSHIKNLTGIDIAPNPKVDILEDISKLSFNDNSADACLCYGSINFGGTELIKQQLSEVYRVLKPEGLAVFRGNMNENNEEIYYDWNEEKISYWTNYFNFKIFHRPVIVKRLKRDGTVDHDWKDQRRQFLNLKNDRSIERLYWIWQK